MYSICNTECYEKFALRRCKLGKSKNGENFALKQKQISAGSFDV